MVYMSNPWHNWTGPVLRDDVRYTSLRQEWYQLHGRKYQHPGQTGVYWDGYPYGPGDERPKYAYYAMQTLRGETLKALTPVKDFGFVPGLSQVLWEANLPIDRPTTYQVMRPDGKTEVGDLAELVKKGGRVVGDLPDGSAIVIATAEGFTARVNGASLGYAFQVVATKDANKKDVFQANLRVAPRSAETVKAGTSFPWRFATVAQVMPNPLRPELSWLTVANGTVTDHWVGATLAAEKGITRFTVGRQPLKVNSTPFTITGVNPRWTVGYFEPRTGLYRPLGVAADGTAYAQVDAARRDLEVVVGNVVTCDQPELRLFAVQDTDADGKATGRWTITAHNPTPQQLDVAFAVSPAFSLIKTRQHRAVIAGGTTITFRLE
jgi:hypothetical protein